MKRIVYILAVSAASSLLLSSGCDRIHEPWLRYPDQLEQERERLPEARQALRHRLLRVQTDR